MKEEIFGPVLTVYVYEDDKIDETIAHMSESTRKCHYVMLRMLLSDLHHLFLNSEFALTGAIYCEQESLVQDLTMRLRQTAGNFYINDKVINSIQN